MLSMCAGQAGVLVRPGPVHQAVPHHAVPQGRGGLRGLPHLLPPVRLSLCRRHSPRLPWPGLPGVPSQLEAPHAPRIVACPPACVWAGGATSHDQACMVRVSVAGKRMADMHALVADSTVQYSVGEVQAMSYAGSKRVSAALLQPCAQ